MMKVKQIYGKYKIPPNLQKHLLRVTALSQILVEKWKKGNLDRKSITLACLFHDMANIIKFDFTKPQLFKEEEKKAGDWKKVQASVIRKYGRNIHLATLKICKEIGLPDKALNIIEDLDWNDTLKILRENNFNSAIPIYCDMRIGPFGIMFLKDRLRDLEGRNKSYDMLFIAKAANFLEKTLQKEISIDVNSIDDYQLHKRFSNLLSLDLLGQ